MANWANALVPTINAQAITKSDATTYSPPIRALYVGGTGDVAITTAQGDVVTLSALPVGSVIDWVYITKVMSTNTTASLLVGFW